jgi:integrase
VPAWNSHRIRPSAAKYLREEFGLEVAGLILGHSDVKATKIYAKRNQAKALEVMSLWG